MNGGAGFWLQLLPSVLYVVFTGISNVLIIRVGHHIPPFESLFISFSIAFIFFNVIHARHLRDMYQRAKSAWQIGGLVNLLLIGIWGLTFYGLTYIDAFAFVFFYFSVLALLTGIALWIAKPTIRMSAVILALAVLVTVYFVTISTTLSGPSINQWRIGVTLAIIGGCLSFVFRKCSVVYAEQSQCTPSMVIATRSLGAVWLWGIYSMSQWQVVKKTTRDFSLDVMWLLVGVAVFTFILPVYFNQKGLQSVGYLRHSAISSFTPFSVWVLAYAFQAIDDYNRYWYIFVLSLVISCFLSYFSWEKYRQGQAA